MTTGTKCCEHHREGLPYCVECEIENDQRREKLHAKLAEAEQASETLESKLAGAEIELEQARAETISLAVEVGQAVILRSIDFAAGESVRPRDHTIWRAMRKTISERDEARAEIERKDKLIEQMREALKAVVSSAPPGGPLWHGSAEIVKAVAAIKAAEAAIAAAKGEV